MSALLQRQPGQSNRRPSETLGVHHPSVAPTAKLADAGCVSDDELTALLKRASAGDNKAVSRLLPLVYADLKRRAGGALRGSRPGHTLQATALVHEAFLKLIDQTRVDWQGRAHFFAIASQLMRRVLVDHARARARVKRGGREVRVELDETVATITTTNDADVLEIDRALEQLREEDPQQADLVMMRFFGGLSVEECAEVLGISKRSAEAEWTMAKAWLRRELGR